jgi:hypothetical protein
MADPNEKFLPKYRGMLTDLDSLIRQVRSAHSKHLPCLRWIYRVRPSIGEELHRGRGRSYQNIEAIWKDVRATLLKAADILPAKDGIAAVNNQAEWWRDELTRLENESDRCMIEKLTPDKGSKVPPAFKQISGDDEWIGDGEEIGADEPQPLEIQTGLWHGNAIAYCPATGHMAIEPLRTQAVKLAKAGLLPAEHVGADMLDALDRLHVGDDDLLELGDDEAIGDDVIEVGRGKLRKKIKKVAKKAVKGIVKASKKVAKGKLGKVIKAAVTLVNPAAGAAMVAVSKGAKVARGARSKRKAKRTLRIAEKRNAGQISSSQADQLADQNAIPRSDVRQTTHALTVVDRAEAGDPMSRQVLATNRQIDEAYEVPLDPDSMSDGEAYEGPDADDQAEDMTEAEDAEDIEQDYAEETPDEGDSYDEETSDEIEEE